MIAGYALKRLWRPDSPLPKLMILSPVYCGYSGCAKLAFAMDRNDEITRTGGVLLLLGLTMLLSASRVSAGERLYYECTLHRVLSNGGSIVMMLGVEDGQVREQALKVASDPYTTCRMKEHRLKVVGNR